MNQKLMTAALAALVMPVAQAAFTERVNIRMGEAGTFTGNDPNNEITVAAAFNTGSGWNSTSNVGVGAANSTDYAVFDGTGSLWGGTLNSLANDNFGVEFWFRLDALPVTETEYMFISASTSTGSLKIGVNTSGQLAVSYHNVTGFGPSTTLTTGTWYHAAVIRDNGTSAFYLNGAQSGSTTTNGTIVFSGSNFRLSETPSGTGNNFVGALDEFRAWNFQTGDDAVGHLNTAAIPEPSTYGLMGAGALAALAVVRRRKRAA